MIRSTAGACFLAAALSVCTSWPLRAADLDVRPVIVERQVVSPGLWRGHFSGGFNYNPPAQNIALDWTDRVEFFPDDLSCRRWMRELRAQYRTYQGYGGCLRIR